MYGARDSGSDGSGWSKVRPVHVVGSTGRLRTVLDCVVVLRAHLYLLGIVLCCCVVVWIEFPDEQQDAGAKHVEVKLKEFGLDLIEVCDNGSGVSPSNYEGLALKYHTSKLSTFSDLTGVTSFGFRGEALSSLCELAGSFSVTTRTSSESVGVKLTYGRDGKLLKKVPAAQATRSSSRLA